MNNDVLVFQREVDVDHGGWTEYRSTETLYCGLDFNECMFTLDESNYEKVFYDGINVWKNGILVLCLERLMEKNSWVFSGGDHELYEKLMR